MMDLFSQKRNFDNEAKKPVNVVNAQPIEKTFTESFLDQWHFQTYTANSYSRIDNLHDEYEKEIDKIKEVTGIELDNPYHTAFGEFFTEDVAKGVLHKIIENPFMSPEKKWSSKAQKQKREIERVAKFYQKANKLKEQYPALEIRNENEIRDDIKKKALAYYNTVNNGRDANGWGDFLGSAAGAVIDPINATLSFVTGGVGSTAKMTVSRALAKTAAYEFVENAGIEAVIQPSVYEYKKELGLPYSKTEAALNVVAAGIGGTVIGSTIKGVHLTGKQVLNKFRKAEKAGIKFDGDAKAAADMLEKQVEFDEWSKASNPYGDNLEDVMMHNSSIVAEMERLKKEQNEISIAYDKVKAEPTGDAFEVLAEIEPEDLEKIVINRGSYLDFNKNFKSKDGFGMVKIIFKHGEKSEDALKLTKDDVLEIPRLVREWQPVESESNDFRKIWRVEENGKKYFFQAKKFIDVDDDNHAVTMYLEYDIEKNKGKPLSKRKSSLDGGHISERSPDTNTQASNNLTSEGSVKTEIPESRFLDGVSATDNSISPEPVNVKDYNEIKLDDLQKKLDDRTDFSPEAKTERATELNALREQDVWDNEILECIVEFSKK